ncbi:head closure Hc1 [Gordonia phage William]|uniref:Head-to-tail connector protein n=2 Tax=Fairfaxidumvirus TaxID=2731207 RepID=A0A5J6TAU8_9CAUD|nr:head closure Hc1 [Gordonia phage Toast]YP_010001230.1 head closure Hc1 [Gordonia phage William]QDF17107.1 hypothetical protein SEA_WILLIAM_12 [Gordonia phage William]QFG08073.1 hypothetical protein PBI_TOAST_12 [Gordonia phage Toast]UVF60520.1 hypothetical protein SEA_PCORAL7_12 [Gordonia phage PCoral7]
MADPLVRIDSDRVFRELNRMSKVRRGVRERAREIAARAIRIDQAENDGRADITLSEHTMPNGRFVVHVESNDVDGEHGNTSTVRRRTLRRAVGSR